MVITDIKYMIQNLRAFDAQFSHFAMAVVPAVPPCGTRGERYLPRMVAITPCASSSLSVYLAGILVSFQRPAV